MASKTANNGKNVLISINPATLEVLGEIPMKTPQEVKEAVRGADRAFDGWAGLGVAERGRYLLKVRDYLLEHVDAYCDVISKENGKPRLEALSAELFLVTDLITYYVKRAPELLKDRPISLHNPIFKATKSSKLVYEPLGVMAVVSPWNYPFAIPMSGILFSLLAGNTVLFKPASDTAMIGLKIDEALNKGAGLPEGVFTTIIASGRAMGTALFEPPVRKVIFTGSTDVGKKINAICAKNLIPTVMELGGKDPMVVCEDADLELASRGAVWGAFMNCGQVCASIERVYVARPIYDRFVELCVEKTKALRVGQDLDHEVDIGPLANEEQLGIVEAHIRDALEKGARILTGGKRIQGLQGYFWEPTILVDVNHTMDCMTEETFGPTLPIMPFDSEDEAVRLANDSVFGLTASVWTKDPAKGDAIARRLQGGTVTVNDHAYTYGVCETPWQGMKESGIGRSHSDAGLMEMVFPKHVNTDHSLGFMKRRMWWYPYSSAAYEVQKMAFNAFVHAKAFPKFLLSVATRKDYRKTLY
ncbi:MAG: aldehyde dehydrogenase family protein [Deltaproteobacteria bacterium]|nr:aldehyde dehydrogenase family protein [Deltaproteobacteria bacterium]